MIEEFSDFAWNWEGISKNKNLIYNTTFIENAFVGNFSFSGNLFWNEILSKSTFDISFWNKNLDTFYETSDSEKQIPFWKSLTRKENQDYIFANKNFPWDWSFITENSTEETILDSFDDKDLFEKWDWKIATRKLDKEIVLDNLEDFARFIDWNFLIKEVFTIENELAMDKQLPRIAACLSVVQPEIRKDIWKNLTAKFPFETLFPIVEATYQIDVFEWDWDFISNYNHFPIDIKTINKFKHKINWKTFSVKRKFEYKKDVWSYVEYFKYTLKYLKSFQEFWDWDILTQISITTENLSNSLNQNGIGST